GCAASGVIGPCGSDMSVLVRRVDGWPDHTRGARRTLGREPEDLPTDRSSHVLDVESQISEHLDGAGLAALEITGGEALTGRERVGGAQDGFGRVGAVAFHQLVGRGRRETVLGEEPLRSEAVVLLHRAYHVGARDLVPSERPHHMLLITRSAYPPSR